MLLPRPRTIARMASSERTEPVGLLGLQTAISRVRGLTSSAQLVQVRRPARSSRSRQGTTVAP